MNGTDVDIRVENRSKEQIAEASRVDTVSPTGFVLYDLPDNVQRALKRDTKVRKFSASLLTTPSGGNNTPFQFLCFPR